MCSQCDGSSGYKHKLLCACTPWKTGLFMILLLECVFIGSSDLYNGYLENMAFLTQNFINKCPKEWTEM